MQLITAQIENLNFNVLAADVILFLFFKSKVHFIGQVKLFKEFVAINLLALAYMV